MTDNLIMSFITFLVGFGLAHFEADDRFSVLNKGKYQLESTGTMLAIFFMIFMMILAILGIGFSLLVIITIKTTKVDMVKNIAGLAFYIFAATVFGFLIFKESRAYNPYFTFVRYDNNFYKIISLTDAGYLVNVMGIVDGKINTFEITKCLPVEALSEFSSEIVALRKKDFDKINASNFISHFSETKKYKLI